MGLSPKLLTLAVCAALTCGGCANISLTKGGGGAKGSGGFLGLGNIMGSQIPPVSGQWQITFLLNEQARESVVTFKQEGRNLSGQGKDIADDGSGIAFIIQNGVVDGKNVRFSKKYYVADPTKQPVDYRGELSFEDSPEYKGWTMGGRYRGVVDGRPVEDKWVAISSSGQSAAQQPAQQPAQTTQPVQQQPAVSVEQPQTQDMTNMAVTGVYTANYDYNFKRIDSRLWLKQTGNRIGGDGIDINTNEHFIITEGFYRGMENGEAARIKLRLQYEKGKHAASTRSIVVHAMVTQGPTLEGQTQFGSHWTAKFVAPHQ